MSGMHSGVRGWGIWYEEAVTALAVRTAIDTTRLGQLHSTNRMRSPPAMYSETSGTACVLQVAKRLQEIDAYGAEARAASILAGLSFDADMQKRATKTFSGGRGGRHVGAFTAQHVTCAAPACTSTHQTSSALRLINKRALAC